MSMKLNERAMLASLHTGSWSGKLVDREVTDEVADSYKAEKDAGRYSKQIVATRFLRSVNSKIDAARVAHRTLTLPWDDDGTRILSTHGYVQYTEQMRLARLAVEAASEQFLKGMPEYIAEARTRLGNMFNNEDYPQVSDMKGKFYIDVEIKPLPEAADFRAKLTDVSVKAITKDIEARCDARLRKAMDDIYVRIADVTGKMAEKLKAYEPTAGDEKTKNNFRDTLVYNVGKVADLIPVLNITDDPRLTKLHEQLNKELLEHSPEILKADAKVRKRTADAAERIFKKVSQILG